jgi:hypothetical protein
MAAPSILDRDDAGARDGEGGCLWGGGGEGERRRLFVCFLPYGSVAAPVRLGEGGHGGFRENDTTDRVSAREVLFAICVATVDLTMDDLYSICAFVHGRGLCICAPGEACASDTLPNTPATAAPQLVADEACRCTKPGRKPGWACAALRERLQRCCYGRRSTRSASPRRCCEHRSTRSASPWIGVGEGRSRGPQRGGGMHSTVGGGCGGAEHGGATAGGGRGGAPHRSAALGTEVEEERLAAVSDGHDASPAARHG